jgi:hypothetical protein
MAIIKTVSPEAAEGEVKEAYSFFQKMGVEVPLPFQLRSASPAWMAAQSPMNRYWMAHPTLSHQLLTHIRLLVAEEENYVVCININSNLLKAMFGLSEEQITATKADPGAAQLEPREVAMLQFVLKAVRDPATTEQADVDALRDLNWSDTDIFDAVYHGLDMVSAGMAFQVFKMGENA